MPIKANGRRTMAGSFIKNTIKRIKQALNPKNESTELRAMPGGLLMQKSDAKSAITPYSEALQFDANHPELHYLLGNALKGKGDLREAIASYSKALELRPNYPEALINRGNIFIQQEDLEAAIASYKKALDIDPNLSEAHINLGIAQTKQGNSNEAIDSFKKALINSPNDPNAHYNLGINLVKQGRLGEAIDSFKNTIIAKPNNAKAHYSLGIVLTKQGKLSEALISLKTAAELETNNSKYFYEIGLAEAHLGNIKSSKISFKKAIDLLPENTGAAFELSRQIENETEAAELIELIRAANRKGQCNKEKSMHEFALANCYHELKDYARAARHYESANNLKLSYQPSNITPLLQSTKKLHALAERIHAGKANDGQGRIFIVGVPRCGSTLLESALTIDPNIIDLGETQALQRALSRVLNKKTPEGPQASLAQAYAKETNEDLKKHTHSIDKNLYNFRIIEAIAKAMPAAKIIHCCRHPLDNILSMLRSNLAEGHNYSADPLDAAQFIIEQEKAMKKMKKKHGRLIFNFNYHEFTSDPKNSLAPLTEWLGIDWNPLFLHPEKNQRIITNASAIQTRSPITKKSADGWKKYKELLNAAESALRESGEFNL